MVEEKLKMLINLSTVFYLSVKAIHIVIKTYLHVFIHHKKKGPICFKFTQTIAFCLDSE